MVFDMHITIPENVETFGDYVVVYLPGTANEPISHCVMMIL